MTSSQTPVLIAFVAKDSTVLYGRNFQRTGQVLWRGASHVLVEDTISGRLRMLENHTKVLVK